MIHETAPHIHSFINSDSLLLAFFCIILYTTNIHAPNINQPSVQEIAFHPTSIPASILPAAAALGPNVPSDCAPEGGGLPPPPPVVVAGAAEEGLPPAAELDEGIPAAVLAGPEPAVEPAMEPLVGEPVIDPVGPAPDELSEKGGAIPEDLVALPVGDPVPAVPTMPVVPLADFVPTAESAEETVPLAPLGMEGDLVWVPVTVPDACEPVPPPAMIVFPAVEFAVEDSGPDAAVELAVPVLSAVVAAAEDFPVPPTTTAVVPLVPVAEVAFAEPVALVTTTRVVPVPLSVSVPLAFDEVDALVTTTSVVPVPLSVSVPLAFFDVGALVTTAKVVSDPVSVSVPFAFDVAFDEAVPLVTTTKVVPVPVSDSVPFVLEEAELAGDVAGLEVTGAVDAALVAEPSAV